MADESADNKWSVRGVPQAARDAAAHAAQRRRMTVGAWLCRAIDREVQAEREPLDLTAAPAADKTGDMSGELSDARARLAQSLCSLELIERSVAAAVALANAPEVPAGFRRRANRLLREGLPAAAVMRRSAPPPLLIDDTARVPLANGVDAHA